MSFLGDLMSFPRIPKNLLLDAQGCLLEYRKVFLDLNYELFPKVERTSPRRTS